MKKINVYLYLVVTLIIAIIIKVKLLDKNLFSMSQKDLANNIFFWGMTGIFIGTIIYRAINDRKVIDEMDTLLKEVESVNIDNINSNFNDINEKLLDNKKYKNIGEIWNSFNDTIIILKTGNICQTVDAENFYNSDSLMKEKMNYKLLNYIPQLLVGLGLLGTFLGLSLGLSGLDLGSNDKQQLNELIDGTKTAFYTSLYGMYYSITISLILTNHIGKYESLILKVKEKINGIFHKYVENETFEEMKNEIKNLRCSHDILVNNIGNELVNGIEKYNKVNEKYMKEVTKLVHTNVEGLAVNIGKAFEIELKKIFSEEFVFKFDMLKKELVEFTEKNNESINNYSKETVIITNNFSKLSSEFIKISQETLMTFGNLMNKFEGKYENINELLLKAEENYIQCQEVINNSQIVIKSSNTYLQKLDKISSNLNSFSEQEKSLIGFWEGNKNILTQLEQNIKGYSAVSSELSAILKETNVNITKSISDGNEKFGDMIDDSFKVFEEHYEKGLKQLFIAYDQNLTEILSKFTVIFESINNSSLEFKDVANSTKENIVLLGENLNNNFEKYIVEVKNHNLKLSKIDDSVKNIENSFDGNSLVIKNSENQNKS